MSSIISAILFLVADIFLFSVTGYELKGYWILLGLAWMVDRGGVNPRVNRAYTRLLESISLGKSEDRAVPP